MPDVIAFPLIGLLAAALIALALVWPQGQGAQSPAPFGHPPAAMAQSQGSGPAPVELRGSQPAPDQAAGDNASHGGGA